MTILKITAVLLGLAFTLFGYLILFKKKYSLINDFDEALKCGEKTEEYAKKVGLIEFVVGIIILIVTAILILFV